jgi:hypothetical protein
MSCNGADIPHGAMMDAIPIFLADTDGRYAMSEVTRSPYDSIPSGSPSSLEPSRTIAGMRSNDCWNDLQYSLTTTLPAQKAATGIHWKAGRTAAATAVNQARMIGAERGHVATHAFRAREVHCHVHH